MWKISMVLMLRSLIGDLDSTKYTDTRLEQILSVGAYNVVNDADFSTDYTVDVAKVRITPDPVSNNDGDFVTLTVYNPIGQEITTLVNEIKRAGEYELQWNAGDLPSGVYVCRMQAGEFVQTRKLVLLK